MRTLSTVKSGDEMFVGTVNVPDVTEILYSAVEYDTLTKENVVSIVCYRTKDGMTHQAEINGDDVRVRRSVGKY